MIEEPPHGRPRRILSIDGGGVRCMVALEILLALENRIIEQTGDPNRKLCDQFDLIAGTSCLLYTSPSPRDRTRSRMPSSA